MWLMKPARTRFAPSPTGFLHVGGVRTALFAWLLARQSGGQFILRIEDTDQTREVQGSDEHIIQSLRTLGLDYDEGPDVGGPFGPYRQSERLELYKKWAKKLINDGRAYVDPYTPEQVQQFREQANRERKPFVYREHRPPQDEWIEWDGTKPLRFVAKTSGYSSEGAVAESWPDAVMGDIGYTEQALDDFILIKSDGFPTYNFAHIIDDEEMKITHVIRGQEFLPSVPNYLNLYDALGFDRPVLATVPHILGPDGQKKLSKRDGAKDVLDYVNEGYLPEALLNFMASLGWNDGTEQEIFSVKELIDKFSLDRVQRGGARFDERRLVWMDGAHIRELPLDDLYARSEKFWPAEAEHADEAFKKQVLGLVQERLKYLGELPELTRFFFVDLPLNPELIAGHKQLGKLDGAELRAMLEQAKASLEQSDFTGADLEKRLNDLLESTGQKPAVLFSLIRIATTQAPASPGLADTLLVLGKDRALKRLDAQLAAL